MIAVAGGFGAAIAFAVSTLCASRASRMIGAFSVLAWVALVGLVLAAGLAIWQRPVPTSGQAVWLTVAGFGNIGGLLCVYTGVSRGRVGIVAPIASTEGAVAAVIAVLFGEQLSVLAALALPVIVAGVVLVAWPADEEPGVGRLAAGSGFGLGAAGLFGLSLFAAGHVAELPVGWVVLPSRIVGSLCVALPLLARRRLRIVRRAVPLVVAAGSCEVIGFVSFVLGARHGVAVAAVIASLFAALAALGAYALFSERLGRLALAGLGAIAVGIGVLSAVQG